MAFKWTEERVALLRSMWPSHKRRDIAKALGVKLHVVEYKAQQLRLPVQEKNISRGRAILDKESQIDSITKAFELHYCEVAERNPGWPIHPYIGK